MKFITDLDNFRKLDELPGKISIRWRKSSATYVIYIGRKILESGFGSEADGEDYLRSYLPKLFSRYTS